MFYFSNVQACLLLQIEDSVAFPTVQGLRFWLGDASLGLLNAALESR